MKKYLSALAAILLLGLTMINAQASQEAIMNCIMQASKGELGA